MSDELPRTRIIKLMRAFAAELREEFTGNTAEAAATGVEAIAEAIRRRVRLKISEVPGTAGERKGGERRG